jgi:hypothetical protein
MPARSTEYQVIRSAAAEFVSSSATASSNRPSSEPFGSDSFSRASSPLRSLFAVPPCSPSQGHRPARVPSLIAASSKASTRTGTSHFPATFRPQVFSTSRRLTPLSTLRAYCIPQPRPGFLRPGVSPDPQPFRLVAGPCPRAVVARTLTDRSRLPRSNASTSRPCSVNRYVPRGWCLAFPGAAPLFGFLLLQALLTHHETGSPVPPLVTFPSKSCPVPEST